MGEGGWKKRSSKITPSLLELLAHVSRWKKNSSESVSSANENKQRAAR